MNLKDTELLSVDEEVDALEILTKVNDINFNILKVVEEMSETTELLVKSLTKATHLKQTKDLLIEEIGDTLVRLAILVYQLDIDPEVNQRYHNKLRVLGDAAKNGCLGTTIEIHKINEKEESKA